MKKFSLFLSSVAGLLSFSVAMGAVPKHGSRDALQNVTDDTAIYQSLSDIRVQRQKELSFDSDIARLSNLENRYHERLPQAVARPERLQKPMKRISERQYRYSGESKAKSRSAYRN